MDAIEALMTTRAMRRYTADPITDDEIAVCIGAANQAPSGGNVQPWQFVVLTDPEQKRKMGEVYKRAYDRYEKALMGALPAFRTPEDETSFMRTARASRYLADTIGDAPVLVAFLMPNIPWTMSDEAGPLDIGTLQASVYPAVQNFMVAARALEIGTTLTTVFRIYQDEVRAILGIDGRFEVMALVPMGRPKGRFGVARRRPAAAVTHWDTYGNRRR